MHNIYDPQFSSMEEDSYSERSSSELKYSIMDDGEHLELDDKIDGSFSISPQHNIQRPSEFQMSIESHQPHKLLFSMDPETEHKSSKK